MRSAIQLELGMPLQKKTKKVKLLQIPVSNTRNVAEKVNNEHLGSPQKITKHSMQQMSMKLEQQWTMF